jgi:DnaJ-class molecular chaperone
MSDLYELLGVPKDAPPEIIHGAYRSKAKQLHPDAGGSTEAFANLANAYRVLSNPQARLYYDQSGEIPPDVPSNNDAQALGLIHTLVMEVFAGVKGSIHADIVELMRKDIAQRIGNAKQQIEQRQEQAKKAGDFAAKFFRKKKKKNPNQLAAMIEAEQRDIVRVVPKIEADIVVMQRADEILSEYGFEFDPPPQQQWMQVSVLGQQSSAATNVFGW